MVRAVLLVALVGCSGGARRDASGGSAVEPPVDAVVIAPVATIAIPKSGPFTLPVEATRCTADGDCTLVSLGCCDTTPVRRDHADRVGKALEASGRQYCSVKTACGPGANGTWHGEPGACIAGACAMPARTPAR